MKHEQALELLRKYVTGENMIKHCLASEAVMNSLAGKLNADTAKWALAGLLHDIDVEITKGNPALHSLEAVKILSENGIDPEIIEAIKMHNEKAHNEKRSTVFHHALAAGETITGLITATALVYPDKKLASVKPKSILKRMKEKSFAQSVDRNIIMECELAGIPLPEFAELALNAMQSISNDLGL